VQKLRQLQAASFPKAWYFQLPSLIMLNSDVIGEKQGFKGWLRSLITRDIKFGEGAKDNEDLSEFDKLATLRKELDPLTIRAPKQILTANSIDGVYGRSKLFYSSRFKNYWVSKMAITYESLNKKSECLAS
jgi:hypothetical protein